MKALDTSYDADQVQLQLLRKAGHSARLEMACALSEGVRQLTRAGIAGRHPEYSTEDVELALRRVVLGDELFQVAWPGAPLRSP